MKKLIKICTLSLAFSFLLNLASCKTENAFTDPKKNVNRGNNSTVSREEEKEWTLLVYMAADNDLETAAITDFNELEYGFSSDSDANVLVLFDRSPLYNREDGDWYGTRLYKIVHDENGADRTIVSETIECPELGINKDSCLNLNMGDGETLASFISFSLKNYPAKKTALILWGHGTGWRGIEGKIEEPLLHSRSLAFDDSSSSSICLSELSRGIKKGLGSHEKLDLIGMDLCFGAEFEIAYELKDCAYFMCGNAGLSSSEGWDYADLVYSAFSSGETVKSAWDFAKIVKKQMDFKGHNDFNILDLSYITKTAEAFNLFSNTLASSITSISLKNKVQDLLFDKENSYSLAGGQTQVFVNLSYFASSCQRLFPSTEELSKRLLDVLEMLAGKGKYTESPSCTMGVYAGSLDSERNIIQGISPYYFHGNDISSRPAFVEKCTSWTPSWNFSSSSLMDKIYYTSF